MLYSELEQKYPTQPEFLQAVLEFLNSISDYINQNPNIVETDVVRRMLEPDTSASFKVVWEDDLGNLQVNRGYKVQFNQALGPYKGGLRFNPNVNESIFKFLAFEQTLKNALTGIPMGGSKGGSDFNPKGKSEREIKRFCEAFMIELMKYSGPDFDVPAADSGVGIKEIGYMFGIYKRITNRHNGVLTSKGVNYGGSYVRPEATGFGLIYMTLHLLKKFYHTDLTGKTILISGCGNVSVPAAEKATSLGAKVVGMSNIDGVIHDENGLDIELVKRIRDEKLPLSYYLEKYPDTNYFINSKDLWKLKADIALPCATQNELDLEAAKTLNKNGVLAVLEGANMPTTLDATNFFIENKVLFVPGKAANAGGVSVSGLEMTQNATHTQWPFEVVDQRLKEIMKSIFDGIYETAEAFGNPYDLVKGANIKAFEKLYLAMLEQGY
ncbi:NADP-specific glutamate dehydrogenase [Acholeplasma equirhinis]|nr:NADP-specific glutamate dehydrogenase [Acholeplasma equirhinis]